MQTLRLPARTPKIAAVSRQFWLLRASRYATLSGLSRGRRGANLLSLIDRNVNRPEPALPPPHLLRDDDVALGRLPILFAYTAAIVQASWPHSHWCSSCAASAACSRQ
jgi:hypothetical protein